MQNQNSLFALSFAFVGLRQNNSSQHADSKKECKGSKGKTETTQYRIFL